MGASEEIEIKYLQERNAHLLGRVESYMSQIHELRKVVVFLERQLSKFNHPSGGE